MAQLAAVAEVDPYALELTYGQLVDAANRKRMETWDPWSLLLSMTYNASRAERARAMTADDWHPMKATKPKSKAARRRAAKRFNADVERVHDRLAKEKPPIVLTVKPHQVIR